MNTQLADGVAWVGFVDWHVRDFHSYNTKRGSTYNAYLVQGKTGTAVIDAVKAPYADVLIANILAKTEAGKVTHLVCNHAEPDHSGGFPALVAAFPQAAVVCNAKCRDALMKHYGAADWTFKVVSEGEKIDLGGKTLQVFDTPMVHWPESMATFLHEDGILFSMDAFGQHYACSARFDDEADIEEVMQEAKTYYANIVLLYARPVENALAKLGTLPIRILAPSHGVIWRTHIGRILAAYQAWRISKAEKKVVIFFASMWGSTKAMAEAIADGALESAVKVKLIDVNVTSDTELVTEVMDCAAFAAGSPTLNMGIMPRMAGALTYLRGLRPAGKCGFAFGSYGWGSKGAEEVGAYLAAMQVEQIVPPLTVRFAPDAATLETCRELGRTLAARALKA